MSGFGYGDGARALRARFDTERLAGALLEVIVHDAFDERDRAFIESLAMF